MITAAVIISGIYPYFPGSGGRIRKPHKDQLASGNCLDDLRADKNPGIFQDEGDIFTVTQPGRDLLDHFPQRGLKAYGIDFRRLSPQFGTESPGAFFYQDLHSIVLGGI